MGLSQGDQRLMAAYDLAAKDLTPGPETAELCCIFVRRMLLLAFGKGVVERAPISLWHLHHNCGDPWGPVTAAIRCGLAAAPVIEGQAGWYLYQGWRSAPPPLDGTPLPAGSSGHAFLLHLSGPGLPALLIDSAAKRPHNGCQMVEVDPLKHLSQFHGGTKRARLLV